MLCICYDMYNTIHDSWDFKPPLLLSNAGKNGCELCVSTNSFFLFTLFKRLPTYGGLSDGNLSVTSKQTSHCLLGELGERHPHGLQLRCGSLIWLFESARVDRTLKPGEGLAYDRVVLIRPTCKSVLIKL